MKNEGKRTLDMITWDQTQDDLPTRKLQRILRKYGVAVWDFTTEDQVLVFGKLGEKRPTEKEVFGIEW